ncbi:50S ribosomal protein L29 [Geopsychrobacter electrodiphilus]|uniref:50S ribosomal protein L29 n=1 Tax=Geopsychrobacter electrodiphilus TaxID=225196 RepID=UPI000362DE91|nr:50S ribosomal protein L29 [Geopsychrobacter electrodiphilus]
MKANEIKDLSVEALHAKAVELEREMFNLRFQLHTGHLENSAKLSQIRKDVARVKTVLNQKLDA